MERPSSGSDLAARFDRSFDYFWHATHQQIYRELARLEEAGMIDPLPEATTRGRKRAYRILPAGKKELKRWVSEPNSSTPLRDELMVRLWAEAAIGPTSLDQSVRERLSQHQAKLDIYRSYEARGFPEPPQGREQALHYLVLQAGIRYETFWTELLNNALAALALPPRTSGANRL